MAADIAMPPGSQGGGAADIAPSSVTVQRNRSRPPSEEASLPAAVRRWISIAQSTASTAASNPAESAPGGSPMSRPRWASTAGTTTWAR